MGAYNRTNGEPCCGSKTLLKDILRDKWHFDGHVTSDCWAIKDFHTGHMVTDGPVESVALAVNNGCDLNCGDLYVYLEQAVAEGQAFRGEDRREPDPPVCDPACVWVCLTPRIRFLIIRLATTLSTAPR